MGIYLSGPGSKCLSIMACLWSADAPASMALDREWTGWRDTPDRGLLDLKSFNVCFEFCFGRLGVA
jgi:hypothetical protein